MPHLEIASVLMHAVALQALIALAVGHVERRRLSRPWRSLGLGAVFALAAVTTMSAPSVLPGQMNIDGRLAIVGLGAACGGALTAAVVAGVAGFHRYVVMGGRMADVGLLSILMSAALRLLCGAVASRLPKIALRHMAAAGAAMSLGFLSLLIRPWAEIQAAFLQVFPLVILGSIASAMVLGSLLKRESVLFAREERLDRAARSDALAGVGNRRLLEETFDALRGPARSGAIAMLDIDHFKRINDAHGHAAGDEILAQFARRLREETRAGDVLVRRGGEEFAILMPGAGEAQAIRIVERILDAVRGRPFLVAGERISVTASAGLAAYSAGGVEALARAMEAADRRLYRAKADGRDRLDRGLAAAA